MKRPNMLSATFVKTVKAPGRYGDGRGGLGLSLLVRTAARGHTTKCWTQSVRIDRRPTSIGLGRYPVVTLALARQRALENAQAIAEGHDPRRRAARVVPTFAAACETVIAIHAPNWKPGGRNEENWRSTLRDYVFPKLASVPVNAVTGTDVMAVLLPIWTTKTETAGRVRRRIGAVMKWAVAQGYRTDNPAGDAISAALPNNNAKITHRQALPHAEVGAAIAKVRRSGAYRGAVLSFEFLVLTAARSAEVRGATWDEIDLEAAVWTIRAERMKAAREHRVPPSDRALVVLDEARRELPQAGNLLFPSEKGSLQGHHPMGRMMKTLGIGAVPDGFCQLPRLGRRVHRDAERGLRTRLGARQQRPRGGCLPAQRPIRAPPRPHAGVGRLRRLPG